LKVPLKVLKSVEEKAKKTVAKNATAVVESKKRKGVGGLKPSARNRRSSPHLSPPPLLPQQLPPLTPMKRLRRMMPEVLPPASR